MESHSLLLVVTGALPWMLVSMLAFGQTPLFPVSAQGHLGKAG